MKHLDTIVMMLVLVAILTTGLWYFQTKTLPRWTRGQCALHIQNSAQYPLYYVTQDEWDWCAEAGIKLNIPIGQWHE